MWVITGQYLSVNWNKVVWTEISRPQKPLNNDDTYDIKWPWLKNYYTYVTIEMSTR